MIEHFTLYDKEWVGGQTLHIISTKSGWVKVFMGSLYLWGRSTQEMGGDVVIGRSIYGVAVIDGSLYSKFYSKFYGNLVKEGYCV